MRGRALAGSGTDRCGCGDKATLENGAQILVARLLRCDFMACRDSARICVNYEYTMLAGIQQNRVGGFWAHAVHREQLLPQLRGGPRKHFGKLAAIILIQELYESFEAAGLLAKVAGRADQFFQAAERNIANAFDRQHTSRSQLSERNFHVRPTRVLRQKGAHDDFEGALCRPPMLASPGLEQRGVDVHNSLFGNFLH
jgi:hypothetical protein